MLLLNRTAVVVTAKQPFLDWLQSVDPTSQEILTEELDGWWRDPLVWPKDLNFRLFTRWFEWGYHSVVYDLAKGALTREEA